jgi:4-hydroxy 2-oxovalerate aldolase
MKVVAFIPIKLNNQRLPGKNTMLLNGRPLCDYLFNTIKDIDSIDRKYVYCSSEDIVPYIPDGIQFLKRDPYLDGFQVKGLEIIERFVSEIDADIYILTHVTQPFIKPSSIKTALNEVINGGYDSAFSVIEMQDYCWYKAHPLNYNMQDIATTQNLEPVYMETGAFFIFKKEVFAQYHQRIGKNPFMYAVDSFEAIDIDTAEDFEFAKAVSQYLVGEAPDFSRNKNVKILDCTLRDGGRIFNCAFNDNEIKQISYKLANAKIDIVEIGFLRDKNKVEYKGNSTFFTDVEQIKPFIDKSRNCIYVAFIDYGMFDFDSLKPYDGTSIDGLRIGFTKSNFTNNLPDLIEKIKLVKEYGYRVFIQTVNSLNYTDKELLVLINIVNQIKPYSFGIVDTYGAMYVDDIHRIYTLIDRYLNKNIAIDFHSHNNYQLSFAFAQEMIKLSQGKRQIIIDATLNGMGKGAGNLNTELIADFLVRILHYDYEFDNILDIIDEHIYDYGKTYSWGYSIPALMAGIYKSHPNNVIYLTEKFRLDTKDIKYIMSMIDPQTRQIYDYDNIERLYIEYTANKIDDSDALTKLESLIGEDEILVMVPGHTIVSYQAIISEYIQQIDPFIISINFMLNNERSIAFFGNQKRYNNNDAGKQIRVITSNIKSHNVNDIVVNYESLIMREGKYFDSSTIMLLNLLRRLNVRKLSIAGFDGYIAGKENYLSDSLTVKRFESEYDVLNNELMTMFTKFVKRVSNKCEIKFITPSIFEKVFLNELC